jgi:multiple sugar transport system substrate-binding protein
MSPISRRDLLRATGGATAAAAIGGAPAVLTKTRRSRAQDNITLRFPSWQQDEPGSSDWFKARIAAFQDSHPGVTIDFTKIPVNEVADKLTTQFAAGDPPQILHIPYLNLLPFASQGFLGPLDPYLANTDILANWTPLQSGCQWDGTNYALLLLAYGYSMIYNEQLLNNAGVAVPTTAEELIAAAKTLTVGPDQFGYGTTTIPGSNLFTHISVWIVGAGGHVTDGDAITINSPEAVQGVTNWVNLVKANVTPTSMETGPLRQLLQQGKLAMWFDGPWGQGFIKTAPPEVQPHLKVAQLPFPHVFGGSSNVIAMPADIPDNEKQLVWEFIQSLTTPEAQAEYNTMYCTPTARTDVTVAEADLAAACPVIDPWIQALNSPNLVDYFPRALATQTADLITMTSETLQRLITSDASVQEELDKLQKELEELKADA